MNNWREFRFVRQGKADLVWMIRQENESYFTRHGQLDGVMQEFSDTPGSKGKEGTKAYVDPVANCTFHVDREIRKKSESGYLELIDGKLIGEQINEINFNQLLPKAFTSYKPQTSISDSALDKLHKSGKARYSRKYDGFCVLAVHHPDGWQIYSRRMDLMSGHFPNHINELTNSKLEVGTLLVGEMLCLKSDGKDDFKATSRVCRSLEEEARKLVESGEVPEPKFIIFDCLFHNKKDLKDTSYDDRAKIWQENFNPYLESQDSLVCHVDYFQLAPDNWAEKAKENGWEGFVVVDADAIPGGKFYSFNGKAERPKGHHKLKPVYNDEVVVYAALRGSGKRLEGVGSVFVKQIHPETGKWFDCGKCGSGFTDETIVEALNLIKQYNLPLIDKEKEAKNLDLSLNGPVLEIEYSERQPGTNKFRYPVAKRFRYDKKPEECEAQRLAPEEE